MKIFMFTAWTIFSLLLINVSSVIVKEYSSSAIETTIGMGLVYALVLYMYTCINEFYKIKTTVNNKVSYNSDYYKNLSNETKEINNCDSNYYYCHSCGIKLGGNIPNFCPKCGEKQDKCVIVT